MDDIIIRTFEIRRSILFLIILFILTGCALLGPSYNHPNIDTPTIWQANTTQKLIESNVDLADVSWWTRFNDPTLNDLIDQALINNNNIQEAIGNIIVAKGELQKVEMSWVPVISLGGTAGIGQLDNFNPDITNPTLAKNIPPGSIANTSNFNYYNGGLVPSYSLNIFRQIKQTEVAKANLLKANYAKDATRLAVISQVAGSYFTLLALNEELREQKAIIADLSDLVNLTQTEYNNGYATLMDVQQYQENLEQAKINLPKIKTNIIQTENALQVLINKNPGKLSQINQFTNIKTTGIIPINLPSRVLRNRPDIKQAEEQLKIANANIGVATASFFPSINLTTPVGGFSNQIGNLFNPSGDFWSAQITAMMPILNLSLYGAIKEQKGNYYVAYYNYIQTVKSAFAEVDNNISNYIATMDSYKAANKLYILASSNARLNYKNYQLGYLSYPESLSSKLTADNAKLTLTELKLQELQGIVSLYQSMAGGYNYNNTSRAKKFGDSHDE